MKTKAIYEDGVLKPFEKLDLPEKAKVRVTIKGSFSKLLEEVGEIEAKEDVDKVLEGVRARNYYV
jgi:predicted DNA-binding antitoxin AbrB/MazE fold protein